MVQIPHQRAGPQTPSLDPLLSQSHFTPSPPCGRSQGNDGRREELAKGALDGLVTSAPTPWDPDQPKPTDPPTNIQNFFLTKK